MSASLVNLETKTGSGSASLDTLYVQEAFLNGRDVYDVYSLIPPPAGVGDEDNGLYLYSSLHWHKAGTNFHGVSMFNVLLHKTTAGGNYYWEISFQTNDDGSGNQWSGAYRKLTTFESVDPRGAYSPHPDYSGLLPSIVNVVAVGDCSTMKSDAIADFDSGIFSPGVAPIQIYEKTTDSLAEISVTHGSVNQDLSNKISYDCFDGMLLLKLTDPDDALTNISNNPPVVANNKFNRFANIAIPSDFTSALIGDQEPSFTISTCTATEQKKGWKLADYKIILERNTELASGGVPAATWGGPGEVFQLSDQQALASTETNVSFDQFKRGSSGAASSFYGGSADDLNPISITPTTLLMYSADSEGFDPGNFTGPYRPTIALRFTYGITETTATAVSIKLYINGTLIQTVSGSLSGSIVWAFSVLGVGDFGTARPPQNNPADSYNGWASPSVTVSITTGATGGKLSAGTKMEDLVLNYTAS